MENERHANTRGWRVGRDQDLSPSERLEQVVDHEGNVRDSLHDLRHRAVRIKAHPLDPIGARLKAAHVQAEALDVSLSSTWLSVWYADVVVSPAELRDDPRRLVVPALSSHDLVSALAGAPGRSTQSLGAATIGRRVAS